MRCVKCGQELPDDANFCRRCGSPTIRNMSYLVQKARENDQEALAEIYKISSPAVYKTIWVLIKDEDTVYDILQDTYVKAFTRLDQLQNPDKLIPWLKMIANNLAKDWLKKSKPVFFTDIYGGEELEDIPFEESIEDVRSELNPEMAMDQQEAKRLVMEIVIWAQKNKRAGSGSGETWNETLQCCTVCILPVSAWKSRQSICRTNGAESSAGCYAILFQGDIRTYCISGRGCWKQLGK